MREPLKIRTITTESFSEYGIILEHVNQCDGYEPLVTVNSKGWIWAILTFSHKTVDSIECHPTSKESFEPVFGTALLVLAPPEEPDNLEVFLLDKPVMLHEGVWHREVSVSDVSRVKITENNDATSETHGLGCELGVVLICIGTD